MDTVSPSGRDLAELSTSPLSRRKSRSSCQRQRAGSDRISHGPAPLHLSPNFRFRARSPARVSSVTFGKKMTPRDYQIIGGYLDVAFLFVVGLLMVLIPKKLIGTQGAEEDRQKKIKILKICGACMLVGSIAQLLLKAT